MRAIGELGTEEHARVFCDYLYAQDIEAEYEKEDGDWVVWVHAEHHLETAAEHLARFQADPDPDRSAFRPAAKEGAGARIQAVRAERKAAKQMRDARGAYRDHVWFGVPVSFGNITIGLLLACLAVGLVTNFGRNGLRLHFAVWHLRQIYPGWELWRLVSPNFLHYGIAPHFLFNMLWLAQLGGQIERRRPAWVYLALVLVGGGAAGMIEVAMNNLVFDKAGAVGGMSGAVYCLLGYSWIIYMRRPRDGVVVDPRIMWWMLGWLGVGFLVNKMDLGFQIANWAHLGGLLIGLGAAYLESLIRDPNR